MFFSLAFTPVASILRNVADVKSGVCRCGNKPHHSADGLPHAACPRCVRRQPPFRALYRRREGKDWGLIWDSRSSGVCSWSFALQAYVALREQGVSWLLRDAHWLWFRQVRVSSDPDPAPWSAVWGPARASRCGARPSVFSKRPNDFSAQSNMRATGFKLWITHLLQF